MISALRLWYELLTWAVQMDFPIAFPRLVSPGAPAGRFTLAHRVSVSPPQLPAEVTSRVQRERFSLQTTHATTPEARAASTTSSSPGTSVSTSNITPSEPQNGVTCRLFGRCRRLQEGSVEYEVRRGGGDDALCSLRVSLLMKRVVDEEMEASSQS